MTENVTQSQTKSHSLIFNYMVLACKTSSESGLRLEAPVK